MRDITQEEIERIKQQAQGNVLEAYRFSKLVRAAEFENIADYIENSGHTSVISSRQISRPTLLNLVRKYIRREDPVAYKLTGAGFNYNYVDNVSVERAFPVEVIDDNAESSSMVIQLRDHSIIEPIYGIFVYARHHADDSDPKNFSLAKTLFEAPATAHFDLKFVSFSRQRQHLPIIEIIDMERSENGRGRKHALIPIPGVGNEVGVMH